MAIDLNYYGHSMIKNGQTCDMLRYYTALVLYLVVYPVIHLVTPPVESPVLDLISGVSLLHFVANGESGAVAASARLESSAIF